jgi:hypothetical protein
MKRAEALADIHAHADTIAKQMVLAWRRIAETEVWLSLPPEMSFDALPNVIKAIAVAALNDHFLEDALRDILRYSAEHGLHRSQDGFQEGYLYTEYHLMRRTLWDYMRAHLEGAQAIAVITRVDAAISLATMAGLRGFHQMTFVQRGDWPDALYRLLDEWPLLGQ